MSYKLYGLAYSPRVTKIQIAALHAKLDITYEEFNPRKASEDEIKEYKKKNPNGKVPTLETPEGPIFESNAILRYIARISKEGNLYGSNKFEEALVDQFLDWSATVLEAACFGSFSANVGWSAYDEATHTQAREKLTKVLAVLDGQLAGKHHLVGSGVTIADIAVCSSLWYYYRFFSDETTRNQHANVAKYVEHIANGEHFKQVAGRYIVSKTPLPVYTGPLPQPEEAKKPEPKKAEPKPKKEAPAPKKKEKKEKDEDDEDDEPKEKKEKNALDSLPPSSFNLFDFKTLFVNAPDKKAAAQTFYEQFDPEGYSCWRMEYEKAEGEGNVLFLTSNLMNGFLQRLETFRKYSFGVVGVYGQEPDLQIRGAWVWRGNEIPFEIKDHPSGEWYKFRKLDIKNNAEDRKVLEDYWCKQTEDEDVIEGLVARDVKYFK